jgi:hypothetical protein
MICMNVEAALGKMDGKMEVLLEHVANLVRKASAEVGTMKALRDTM